MIKIDRHISELLKENECVIVPKMGGFVISSSPRIIHSSEYVFDPSSAKLSFNALLNYNDGLLANHIVQHESLTYDEAMEAIEEFTKEFHETLKTGDKFIIEEVGILHKEGMTNEFNQQIPVATTLPPPPYPQRKNLVFKRSRVILFALLLTGSTLAFCLNAYISSSSKSESDNNAFETKAGLPMSSGIIPENVNGLSSKINESTVSPISNKPSDTPPPISENKYFIIAGSFRSYDNAQHKLDELKLLGFINAQLFSDSRQLQLVCFGCFNTFQDAQINMENIRVKYKEAWIYKR